MSVTHSHLQRVTIGNLSIAPASEFTFTANAETTLEESIGIGTDTQVNVAIDVSAVKSFYLLSDVAATIETNSGSSPTNTITLVAGIPYIWHSSSYDTFKLTGDVTALFVTNAAACALKMYVLYDPTP